MKRKGIERKGIEIKGRFIDVPMTVNQVYWPQYKRIIEAEVEKGRALTQMEILIAFLGETEEYWRSKEDVEEHIYLCVMLQKIYWLIKARKQRTEIKKILISESLGEKDGKRNSFFKRFIKKVRLKADGIPLTEIQVDDKEYNAPTDLNWYIAGQYHDALDVTSVIHENTEYLHFMEAYERLFKIYFYAIITGKEYDVEVVLNMDINKVRWRDVLDFGGFFLLKSNGFQNGIVKKLPKLLSRLTNSKRATMT